MASVGPLGGGYRHHPLATCILANTSPVLTALVGLEDKFPVTRRDSGRKPFSTPGGGACAGTWSLQLSKAECEDDTAKSGDLTRSKTHA